MAFLAALFGLSMTKDQAETYRRHTGRQTLPEGPAAEAWMMVGRRSGKSRIAALIAVGLACFRSCEGVLSRGERGVVMVLAADRKQAGVIFRYVRAFPLPLFLSKYV